jgi:carbonic anhydrase
VAGVGIAYGVYVLAERLVWAPRIGSDAVAGLAAPPADAEGFVELCDAVMRSTRITRLLGRGPAPA